MTFDNIKNSGISFGVGSVIISNTSFSSDIYNQYSSARIRPGLELLQKRVATSAFHNSAHRVDPPRCHPDTRVAIQKQVYDWIISDLFVRQTWIMWMHGAAGGGKSAIMQSIAELCEKAEIPLASFFFDRTDSARNSMVSFVATLIYSLIHLLPQVQDEILGIIESNPLIFDQSLKSQLQTLIFEPLFRMRKHIKGFFVILIDGLDECIERAHQAELIKLLGTLSNSRSTPVIFLVASRREPQIQAAFVHKQMSGLVLTLPLDNSDIEQTSDDIRRFLVDKFREIKDTHPRRHLFPINWPPVSSIEEIVRKSSGQFIIASTSINYLSSSRANPARQLEVLRGIRLQDPSSQHPFAHLDALYVQIFSQVEALDKVLEILAYMMITGMDDIQHIESVFLLEPGELEQVYLSDLAGVIRCEFGEVSFLHALLPDFLQDKIRSERYYIDAEERLSYLLRMFLERGPPISDSRSQASGFDTVSWQEYHRVWAIRNLLAHKPKASDELQRSFVSFSINPTDKNSFEHHSLIRVIEILKYVEELNFNDRGQVYRHVLDIFAPGFARYWSIFRSSDKDRVKNVPDLSARISQILGEKL